MEDWVELLVSYSKFSLAIYFIYDKVYVSMLLSQFILWWDFLPSTLFFLPVRLPSEIRKLPPDPPVRGFPGVWQLTLLWLPSRDGSPSLALLSPFLSFIFCPTSFLRQWAAFLGTWCPLLKVRSCFVKFAQCSNVLQWICRGESGLAILFLRHLTYQVLSNSRVDVSPRNRVIDGLLSPIWVSSAFESISSGFNILLKL